jgi:hypothetical protein
LAAASAAAAASAWPSSSASSRPLALAPPAPPPPPAAASAAATSPRASASSRLWKRSTSARAILKWWQFQHRCRASLYSVPNSRGLYTGTGSSTWPKCPGHAAASRPHVTHGAGPPVGPIAGS